MYSCEFADKIEKIKSQLYKTAYLYLNSEACAIDAVDEAVYKGLKSIKKLRKPEFFTTWMTRILINECLKELKHRKRITPVEEIPEENAEEYDNLPLRDAVHRLPLPLKEVIILRFFASYTLSETAESLNIPQGTVVTRQRRALKLLKLELSEEV